MERNALKSLGLAGALLCLAQPQIALAQDCVAQADLADATVYAMPILYDAYTKKCGEKISKNGFIAKQGKGFIAPYVAKQDQKWPGAARLLSKFAASGKKGVGEFDLLSALPESAIRPFVDGVLALKIGEEIKVKDCGKIERTVELLAPLPPENMGGVLVLLVDFAGVKEPKLCPYVPK